jgi:hypothetical protein
VDLERGVLAVRRALAPDGKTFTLPKSGKGRSIRLTSQAVEALKDHRKAQDDERSKLGDVWKDNGLVFPSTVGTPMNPDNLVYRSFKPLLRRAGLKEIRFHDLRHTFARDCIFTIEYSVRTAMEAVYSLLDIERGVPEPWGSQYDIGVLLNSGTVLRDGERLRLPDLIVRLLEQSDIGDLLRDYGWIGELDDPDLMTVAVRNAPPRGKVPL